MSALEAGVNYGYFLQTHNTKVDTYEAFVVGQNATDWEVIVRELTYKIASPAHNSNGWTWFCPQKNSKGVN